MKKTIVYQNAVFVIKYDFTTERKIDGKTTHTIYLLDPITGLTTPYSTSWTGMLTAISFKEKLKELLDRHLLETNTPNLNAIEEWDGNLDRWLKEKNEKGNRPSPQSSYDFYTNDGKDVRL